MEHALEASLMLQQVASDSQLSLRMSKMSKIEPQIITGMPR